MSTKSKPMSIEEINKIEMMNDRRGGERFEDLLRKVVSVPKKEIDAREKKETTKRALKPSNA